MVEYLMMFVGLPYIWAGNSPMTGFDCSGLVCEGLRSVGIVKLKEDLTSQEIYNKLLKERGIQSVDRLKVRKNDILFFGRNNTSISHVSIATNGGQMVEAAGGDSTTETKEDAIKRNAFVRVRAVSSRSDFIAGIRVGI